MSGLERYYWHDEMNEWEEAVAHEADRPLVFGVSRPDPGPNKKAGPRIPLRGCRHWRQRFDLEERVHVFASAKFDSPAYRDDFARQGFKGKPAIGFYLDRSWARGQLLASPGAAPHLLRPRRNNQVIVYPWEDFQGPNNPRLLQKSLRWLLKQAKKGLIVEIGCAGGHGRTGTVLAGLLVIQGRSPASAIARVRTRYCDEAVESSQQREFIYSLAR